MRFESEGYRYRRFELGQKVMYNEAECIIIGFDEEDIDGKSIALYTGEHDSTIERFSKSCYATIALKGYGDCEEWKWVKESDIIPIDNNKVKKLNYKYEGHYLGQKVNYKDRECIIIGFDETKEFEEVALTWSKTNLVSKLGESKFITSVLEGYEDEVDWVWAYISDLESIHNQHTQLSPVLSIKTTQINDKYSAVEITYQNEDVLNRSEFYDKEIGVICTSYPDYSYKTNTLFIKGWKDSKDNQPFIIENQYVEVIEEKVKLINEKYGIPKRWRAERNCAYYYINDCMNIVCSEEIYDSTCDARYMKGNYFKTEEEAKEKLEEIKNILVGDK